VRYPYERFLRYLVSRKANVNGALERIGLPRIGDLWVPTTLARLRKSAPPSVAHYLDSPGRELRFKEGFLEWAEREEIRAFWEQDSAILTGDPDPAFAQAGDLFYNALTRTTVGTLLLCGFRVGDVASTLEEIFGWRPSDRAVSLYETHYWDYRRACEAFWTDVIPSFQRDERQSYAIGLRWPPPKLYEVRHWLGLPTDEDPAAALTEVMVHALGRFRAEKSEPIPDEEKIFRNLAFVERTADKLMRKKGGALKDGPPNQDAARQLTLFSVVPEKARHPTLAELSGDVSAPTTPSPGRR
jgi:hypothetical protein